MILLRTKPLMKNNDKPWILFTRPSEADCKVVNLFDESDETYDEFWNTTLLRNTKMTRSEAFESAMETYADNVYGNSLNHDMNRSVLWIVDYLTKYGMREIEALKIGLLLADESLQALKAKTDALFEDEGEHSTHMESVIMEIAELIL